MTAQFINTTGYSDAQTITLIIICLLFSIPLFFIAWCAINFINELNKDIKEKLEKKLTDVQIKKKVVEINKMLINDPEYKIFKEDLSLLYQIRDSITRDTAACFLVEKYHDFIEKYEISFENSRDKIEIVVSKYMEYKANKARERAEMERRSIEMANRAKERAEKERKRMEEAKREAIRLEALEKSRAIIEKQKCEDAQILNYLKKSYKTQH
jgi:hypothetical protein